KRMLFDKARRAIGMANINATELRQLPFFVPPIWRQEAFDRLAVDVFRHREMQQRTAAKVELLGASLRHRAFDGSLTAAWRESHMKELLQEIEQQARTLSETALLGAHA